jgi:hypothetical protein
MPQTANFNSSNLNTMVYDEITNVLRLGFVAGATYEYYGVPQVVVNELRQAASAGSYFHQFIRNKYEFRRVV